jgi:hypothetical protein
MHHTNTHIPARAKNVIVRWVIACLVMTMAPRPITLVSTANAASAFRPTVFVNTEAFLAIDDDDTTADVVLRFGDTLAKTLTFNRVTDRFEFNDDVYTSGSLTASGTIVTESGAYIDGSTLVVQANSDRVGIGTAAPLASLHVVGAETRLDTGTTNGTTSLSFVDNNDEKAHFLLNQATGTFDIQSDGRIDISSSDYVNVSGVNYTNIQGSTTFTGNNVGIGTTGPKTRLDVVGAISGSFVYATKSFSGAGLSDCDSGTSKLLWDATTGRFSCGTVSSGISLADGDARYVKKSGDTMTGALAVQNGNTHTPTGTALLNVRGVASGATLYANAALRSSGSLVWEGIGSGAKLFVNNFLSVGSRASGSLLTIGRVGSGTRLATMTNATLFSTDQMALGQLEGGAYFGRVGLKENQWGLSTYGTAWMTKGNVQDWRSVAMSSDGKIQTSINSGHVFSSKDYGMTWIEVSLSYANWKDIAMSSDGKIQTLVANSDLIYVSYDYGETWSTVETSRAWESISMSSDGKIQTAAVLNGFLYVSYDYGKTWAEKGPSDYWRGSAMTSDGKIQAVGGNRVYMSYDYGQTWQVSPSNYDPYDVAMSSDGRIIAAATWGSSLSISYDYGHTWTSKASSKSWRGIAMSSDGRVMIAGPLSDQLHISTDYGNTWTPTNASGPWWGVAMSSDAKVITALENAGGNIHISFSDSYQYGSVAIGTGSVKGNAKLMVQGILSGVTLYATRSFSGAGLSDCDTAGTSKLLWDATTGRFSCGTDQGTAYTAGQGLTLTSTSFRVNSTLTGAMLRFLTVSGSTVFAKDTLASSGTILLKNTATSADMLVISTVSNANGYFDSGTNNNAGLVLRENSGNKWTLLSQGTNDNFVIAGDGGMGTDDFLTIGQSGNVGVGPGGTMTPKAKLAVTGTISGTTVYALNSFSGAGLTSCSNATTSKLLWDETTGRFSCGTDQTGGSSGGGLSLSDADARYVRKSGGTMTGALTVQNGNAHSDTTAPLITVHGTLSGKGLAIYGGGFFRGGNGDVNGDGTQAPADLLAISNYLNGNGTSNLLTAAEYARADVNGDGSVTWADYYMISNYSLMDAAENADAKHMADSAWTIDLDGDFGIGTSTPETKLDVAGTISGSSLSISGLGEFYGNVGVGNSAMHSTFTASGSFATRARIMTATGSINGHDNIIFASGSSMISVTLPSAVNIAGRQYTIKKTSSPTATDSRPVIVKTTSSQTIDRLSQWRLTIKNQEVTVVSDGSNWQVFNGTSSYGINGGYMAIGTTMNQWYGASADATALTTAVLTTTATIRVLPFVANRVMTINGMAVSVQTTAASAQVRLGLYNDNGRGYPDTLVVDAGTVATTTTGVRTICPSGCTTTGDSTLPVTIQPGLYWIAINNNSIAHTLRGYAVANLNPQSGFPSNYTTLRNVGWQIANTFTNLPSTFPSGATATTAVPLPAVTMRMQE